MADVSEFAPKRGQNAMIQQGAQQAMGYPNQNLDGLEDAITQHRRATDQSTYQADTIRDAGVPARDALTDIAIMLASLPLRLAMEMAEAVVTLPEFKAPENKIQLAMLLNEWAEKRLAAQYADR